MDQSASTSAIYCRIGLRPCLTAVVIRYPQSMADLQFQVPVTEEVEVDGETLAAIDRSMADADAGRTLPIEEVRNMIPTWLSKFASQKPL